MSSQAVRGHCTLALTLLFLGSTAGLGEPAQTGNAAIQQDRVVAGSPKDFMEVRHLVLGGSNEAIGRALATIAHERYQTQAMPSADPLRTRVQRRYLEKNYPIMLDRMRGVAGAFGRRLEDDAWNFSGLFYPPAAVAPGCSVVHFPRELTATGSSIVSRDYDFTTGTMRGTRPPPGQLASTARPYVIEMYPDRGYPSLALYSYDLLGGVLDGINSEGLTLALLADDELMSKFRMEPVGDIAAGLGSLQVPRFLLDTCASVEEAKEALLLNKQYYEFVPVHYLIADRHGKSFIWEYSQAHNREYIVENPGKPLITTNFSLHRYLEDKNPPGIQKAKGICPRYCILTERLIDHPQKLTVDYIKESHKLVDATAGNIKGSGRAPNRTLWHALYFPEQRKMQISFYLRDEANPEEPGKSRIVRSEYLDFALDNRKVGKK
jgi:hypothetical protein